ncbi:preprotein translocase subunit SecY [Candidatus Micrarchaeota archaeon]|nr:preprotein translocase subunit SecY [Candidatus Micrarchaeota archaeon]
MGIVELLQSVAKYLPEVKGPPKPLLIKQKLFWTGVALVLFFMMYNTLAFGIREPDAKLDFLQTITASRTGTLLTAGIGPIVLAGIFLQLFVGAGVIKIDLKDTKDRQKFQESQKVLAIVLAFVEAIVFVISGRTLIVPLFGELAAAAPITTALVVLQIALGSILVLYLDEMVTKYGIGSGISVFIAANVSYTIIQQVIGLIFDASSASSIVSIVSTGGANVLSEVLIALLPLWFTILVFFVVAYAESMKVEIPISFERVRGMIPKLPLKFFYVSNIPIIFASALLINVQLFAGGALTAFYYDKGVAKLDFSGGYDFAKHGIMPLIAYTDPQGNIVDGALSVLTPLYGRNIYYNFNLTSPIFGIPLWLHALLYVISLSFICVMFGMFWVEVANMDAKSMAGQLTSSGLQIPGFRRDPRMLEQMLNKHIYPLTILGSFCVGLLASIADMTGALGTGTGILLTVGILHKIYEDFEKEKFFDMYPSFNSLVGSGESSQ